jgi:hypothetical protein
MHAHAHAGQVRARIESLEMRSSSMNSMSDFSKTKARHSKWVGSSVRHRRPGACFTCLSGRHVGCTDAYAHRFGLVALLASAAGRIRRNHFG